MADEANELILQFQAEILALQEAVAADAAAAVAAPAARAAIAAAVAAAALAPALANTTAFLNFTSSSGSKHFRGATEAPSTHSFDFADPTDLKVFLDFVLKKAQVWGGNPSSQFR
jgi:hypothetical protein